MIMQVTATEFSGNISKYLALAQLQDILITKDGKSVAKLTNPNTDKLALLASLVGIVPDVDMSADALKRERLAKQCE